MKTTTRILTTFVIGLVFFTSSGAMAAPGKFLGSWNANSAMYSLLPGGVVIQTDNPLVDPNFGNLAFSNGHGTWKKIDNDTISVTYVKFGYAADGTQVMQVQASGEAHLSAGGKELSFELSINGNPLNLEAQRIK